MTLSVIIYQIFYCFLILLFHLEKVTLLCTLHFELCSFKCCLRIFDYFIGKPLYFYYICISETYILNKKQKQQIH